MRKKGLAIGEQHLCNLCDMKNSLTIYWNKEKRPKGLADITSTEPFGL